MLLEMMKVATDTSKVQLKTQIGTKNQD